MSSEEARMEQLQVAWRRQWEEMEKERQMQWEEDRKKEDEAKKEQLEGLWRRQCDQKMEGEKKRVRGGSKAG